MVPSGDGRWIGRGYLVEGSNLREHVTLLRARRVGLNEVSNGQLGVRLALGEITKEDGVAFEQADRTVRALERHDRPPHGSATVELVRTLNKWTEVNAMQTSGRQVYALTSHGSFLLCQDSNQSVLLVERNIITKGSSADGLYAELWAVSW